MLKQEGVLEESVVSFSEFFSIGPIHQLHTNEGQLARKEWLVNNLTAYDSYFEDEYLPRFKKTVEVLHSPEYTLFAAHEHVGLSFVIAQLKDKKNIELYTSEASKEIFQSVRGTGRRESLALICKLPSLYNRSSFEHEWDSLSKSTNF